MQLEKVYEPQRFESHWAQWWIESKIYQASAERAASKPYFSLVIPPPNVTGSLHIGHMFEHTMMDVAVRWHRMSGQETLWLPGTDHAGIATQLMVERQLATENLTRTGLGREEFEKRIWQWKEDYGNRITTQIRREGASVDWSRERFTLDAGLTRAVREAFFRLWSKGLIYRGEYMVNWCPRCQTAISDLETIHEAAEGSLWYIRYQVAGSSETLTVATTRPETMLGDTALVVHPDDPRYLHLHGKTAILPLVKREIVILPDPMVDPKFGTGVVKVTPAHDANDFEVARRHKLPFIKVIGEDAKMTALAGEYAGLDRFMARKRILAALDASGELVNTEKYTLNLAKCDRCRTIIEPLVSKQWFVTMKPLAEKAMEAVRTGRIRFVPTDREPVFFQWMENIRDWCVSRQLWWGHRIPAWYCGCGEVIVARETPTACPKCGSEKLEQESDVLDTWFSSGLWPFSTLGWPDQTPDLAAFYPTTLMITGFDILFFWLSRMIMLGIEMTDQVPFREVHIHGLVRDADKQKMSKTKGNVIDPLLVMDKYGTDAVRLALLVSAAAGSDIALKEDRMEAGRAFANKLWNASRLLFMNMERSNIATWSPADPTPALASSYIEDIWIFNAFKRTAETVNRALLLHRYHEAAQVLWDFTWHEFCDWYLEVKKLRFEESTGLNIHWEATLTIYEATLRLMHPVMPFLTEELWQRLIHGTQANTSQAISVSLGHYPTTITGDIHAESVALFELLRQIITASRELRADNKIETKAVIPAALYLHSSEFTQADLAAIASIAKLDLQQHRGTISERTGLIRSTPDFDLQLKVEVSADSPKESRARIEKEVEKLTKNIANSERQLLDDLFLSKAPEKVIDSIRAKLAEYREQLAKNKKLLEGE